MSYRVRVSDVNRISRGLIDAATSTERTVYRAINKVASKTLTRSRREIVSQVMLTQTYVRERMSLQKAGPNRNFAVITARQRPTTLATYGAKQLTRQAKKAKGDARRSIPAWRKQAGVSVKVKRAGSRKQMRGAFFVPLKAGAVAAGNGVGVFVRTGTGTKDIKHLYGPSVDQVFRTVREKVKPEVERELRVELKRLAALEAGKAIKGS